MHKEVTILIGGEAGQGIQTIGALLAKVCSNAGLFIFSMDDFESRVRGGHSFHLLRISTQALTAPCLKPDILVALDGKTLGYHKDKLSSSGISILNSDDTAEDQSNIYNIPLVSLAEEAGGKIASNIVAAGAVLAIIGAAFRDLEQVLKKQFSKKGESVLAFNLKAAEKGYETGKRIDFALSLDFNPVAHQNPVMNGAKAAALGALAADCRFVPFYPMSPGTSIISNLVPYADQLPVVIEQAEDEIAAVNMAIGASFAGVRSMISTSGGGFCLMVEGLGFAAMSETPIVILNAQRPGPATGLATRTAQADLLFAINASQDEFPRFVFAPGGIIETFNAVKKAFFLSEKYQVPSIVLMDQFLVDSAKTETGLFKIGHEHESFLEKDTKLYQAETYLRYKITDTGVSPRRIPCDSESLVRATGNEHTQRGLSFENPENRNVMVEKRFKKFSSMKNEMTLPEVFHDKSAFFLTAWGSTKGSVIEAGKTLRDKGIDVGWIIFEDIWPLDSKGLETVIKDKKLIVVEGNATCQLGSLIRQQTGVDYFSSILKYDGRPIYPEYIIKNFKMITGQ